MFSWHVYKKNSCLIVLWWNRRVQHRLYSYVFTFSFTVVVNFSFLINPRWSWHLLFFSICFRVFITPHNHSKVYNNSEKPRNIPSNQEILHRHLPVLANVPSRFKICFWYTNFDPVPDRTRHQNGARKCRIGVLDPRQVIQGKGKNCDVPNE